MRRDQVADRRRRSCHLLPMNFPLPGENTVRLRQRFATKWDAIAAAGDLLVAAGHVAPEYVALMFARERLATTYIGNGVALPHATREGMALVRDPGISVLAISGGVDFGDGQVARLVFGLAARDDSHLDLLTHLATICADDARLERLLRAATAREMVELLSPEQTA
jgi:mannitol/fructose-specific phosphotransferase system IIA component